MVPPLLALKGRARIVAGIVGEASWREVDSGCGGALGERKPIYAELRNAAALNGFEHAPNG